MAEHTPTHFALAELLPLIFNKSKTSDLICYRLVSQQWRKVATTILLKKHSLKISFQLDKQRSPTSFPTFCLSKHPITKMCNEHFKLLKENPEKLKLPGEIRGDLTLPDFFRYVTNPDRQNCPSSFPAAHFEFRFRLWALNRNQPQLLSFAQNYGVKIKKLTLDNCIDYFVGHPGMPNFILQYTPNLESLIICETLHRNVEIPADCTQKPTGQKFTLAHLKTIEVNRRPEDFFEVSPTIPTILKHLLLMTPQLTRVSVKKLKDLKWVNVFLPGKLHLLNVGQLSLGNDSLYVNDVSILEDFVRVTTTRNSEGQGGVTFSQLKIDPFGLGCSFDVRSRGNSAIRQIFQANVNSLHTVHLAEVSAAVLHRIRGLPALPKVTKLILWFSLDYEFALEGILDLLQNPPDDPDFWGNSLSFLFPNLEAFEVIVHSLSDVDGVTNLFPYWNEQLPSVKTLKTKWKYRRDDPDGLLSAGVKAFDLSSKLCPKTEKLDICWPYCRLSTVVTPIWVNLGQLTSLKLKFYLHDKVTLDTHLDLDAAFTGLDRETVTAVFKNWEDTGEWKAPKRGRVGADAEKVEEGEGPENCHLNRVNPSVLDLQNLQKLDLEFDLDKGQEPRILVSEISAKFGFDLLQNFSTRLIFNFRRWLPGCLECRQKRTIDDWLQLHKNFDTHKLT